MTTPGSASSSSFLQLLSVAVGLPWVLSSVWRKYRMPREPHLEALLYREWRRGDFAVWGSRLHGMHAAIDILPPLAAVAFGLTAIGIVFALGAAASP
jgi:hypothetical protein